MMNDRSEVRKFSGISSKSNWRRVVWQALRQVAEEEKRSKVSPESNELGRNNLRKVQRLTISSSQHLLLARYFYQISEKCSWKKAELSHPGDPSTSKLELIA